MSGIRQRKMMAMGKGPLPGNDVGDMAKPGVVPHPDANKDTGKTLSRGNRALSLPTGGGKNGMMNPGTVDHGPLRRGRGQ